MLVRTPVDGRAAWLITAAGFCVYAFTVGLQYITGIFYKQWLKEPVFAHVSPADLAWATSIEGAMFLLGSLFAGKLILRFSCSTTTIVGAGLLLLGSLAAALIDAPTTSGALTSLYIFFGFTLGLGTSLAHVAALVGVQPYFQRHRGLATGITVAGSGTGAFVLGPVLEFLVATQGWRTALVVYGTTSCAVCCVAAVAMASIQLQEEPACSSSSSSNDSSSHSQEAARPLEGALHSSPKHEVAPAPQHEEAIVVTSVATVTPPPPRPSYHELLRMRFFWRYSTFIAIFSLAWFTVPTYLPVTVTWRGGGSGDVSAVVAAHGVANMVARVAMGVVIDRLPQRKVALVVACMLLAATGSLVFTCVDSLAYAVAYGAIVGGFGGAIVSIQPGLMIDYVGMALLPLAQGAINGIQSPLALAGAPIGGALRAATGGYTATWAFVTACLFLACGLATRISGSRFPAPAAAAGAQPPGVAPGALTVGSIAAASEARAAVVAPDR